MLMSPHSLCARLAWLSLLACVVWGAGPGGTPALAESQEATVLEQYVHADDEHYDVEVTDQRALGPSTVYTVRLTSQRWRDRDWTHWLSIVVPDELRHDTQAILVIAGGRNNSGPPDLDRSEAQLVANFAASLGAPAAVVQQIPNQPLFENRREDDLIAYTFARFLATDDERWPALLPMVKGAVRAMDGVRDVLREQRDLEIEQFIVTGGSKRGWTTYLTAAIDERVKAMAPLVFDILDMEAQIEHQRRSFGDVSRMIREYANHGVIERIHTPGGRALQRIVDPFQYRDRLVMPKLIMLGANDPYWTVDASNLYVDELPGPTYLQHIPNAGHSLNAQAISTAVAFLHAALDDEPLPELRWQRENNGGLEVEWDEPATQVRLYEARAPTRDFREATWRARTLEGEGHVTVSPDEPAEGWLAYFVQVEFAAARPPLAPYTLSTPITVLPEALPH